MPSIPTPKMRLLWYARQPRQQVHVVPCPHTGQMVAMMLENDPQYSDFMTMMVKTHLSLTHDPAIKGTPKGWTLPIRDVLIYSGAKFLCPCAGTISLMPDRKSVV